MMDQKSRINFDDWYAAQVAAIGKMSIAEVRTKRNELKSTLEGLHTLMRENGIKDSRKRYLKGRRKFVTQLLAYTKERIKLFNTIAHNGVSQNLALRFVQIAAEELAQGTFQRIYALSVMDVEEKESSIEAIKGFVAQFYKETGNERGN